ncbi:MAG: cytochrome b/b6 domain-containing protein [Desulfobacterales bacterium]
MKYDRGIRWIHAGIALGVTIQLVTSQLMQVPHPGKDITEPGLSLFMVHRWSGISVFALVILHWLWGFGGHIKGGWGHFFPWFSKARFEALISDVKAVPGWLRGRFPDQRTQTAPLVGAVHGLGLLAVSAMVATGATIFFGMAPDGSMPAAVKIVAQAHSIFAGFIIVYYLCHIAMALFHQLRGEPLITDMFNLKTK